jgi:hypothetical protein
VTLRLVDWRLSATRLRVSVSVGLDSAFAFYGAACPLSVRMQRREIVALTCRGVLIATAGARCQCWSRSQR